MILIDDRSPWSLSGPFPRWYSPPLDQRLLPARFVNGSNELPGPRCWADAARRMMISVARTFFPETAQSGITCAA
jgi:hypothetical protein